jgi:hypothetical protein
MNDLQIALTAQERDYLVKLLEEMVKETRVEEHRTRTLSYREHIVHQKELILGLLTKLGHPGE